MNRRMMMKMGLVGTAAAVIAPRAVLAETPMGDPFKSPFAGALFYTADAPGRWAGKQGGHVPMIERSGSTIKVTTGHEMDGFNHYIIKHIIMDDGFGFVDETMFNPESDAPISQHEIGGLKNLVYAISLCNKHDAWLNVIEL